MATEKVKSVFEALNAINVNNHTEKKNGLTYLSWAWAWAEVKKAFPESFYTIYENGEGRNYHHDGNTAWVKTGVTIVWYVDDEGCVYGTSGKGRVRHELELIEDLPVMDFRNASIKLDNITSFDVNKAIQRSLTKACARHGIGLYIYAGEDLPEGDETTTVAEPKKVVTAQSLLSQKKPASKGKAEAWKAYKELPDISVMSADEQKANFAKFCVESTGKDVKDINEDDWNKIINDIDVIKAM